MGGLLRGLFDGGQKKKLSFNNIFNTKLLFFCVSAWNKGNLKLENWVIEREIEHYSAKPL